MPLAQTNMWLPGGGELALIGPLWALAGTIVALLLCATFITGRNWRVSGGIAFVGGLATAILAAMRFKGLSAADGSPSAVSYFAGFAPTEANAPMLIVDQFSCFFIALVGLFLALVTALWYLGQEHARLDEHEARKHDATEFFVLLIGSALGMSLMVSTTNLLMLVLSIEMASLPSYALAGFRKRHRLSAEASVKYVLFGAVTSAIMVYGASLLYGYYKTLDLATIGRILGQQIGDGNIALFPAVALFALLVGVCFKVSAVPFHFWCPDVFEGAAIEVTTWLSVVSKAAGLGLMLRILSCLTAGISSPNALQYVALGVGVLATATCTVGNLSAFWQTNMKRLLAFSSIAHAGYMLMAVAILLGPEWFAEKGTAVHPGYSVVAAYVIVYLFMNLAAFGIVAMVYWATGKETIDAFNGLGWRNPALGVCMTVCLFSLVGLPPFGGFIVKWYLLAALYDSNYIWLIFVAVFNTLISLYFYARVAYAMWFVTSDEAPIRASLLGQAMAIACAAVVILTGTFYAGRLKVFSDARSRDLYAVSAARVGSARADADVASAVIEKLSASDNASRSPAAP